MRKQRTVGKFMEKNTVERAVKTQIDILSRKKWSGQLGWFMSVSALSPVNNKGLYQGRGRFSQKYIQLKRPIQQKKTTTMEEQNEKAESCWENLCNEIQLKGP